ncbi:MAG TPA: PIN domain-containing protein [Stellaceae bacterium]|nr:PIN domain-containing protein [Stellaceae bacterium]
MRAGVLLDTGPIVAFLYGRERDHGWAVERFATLDPPFLSCEPVLTEACFLVARNGQSPVRVLDMLTRGIVRVGLEIQDELAAVGALMARYASVPMSLADACLVRLAEMTGSPICTLDADFAIYRAHGRQPLTLISPAQRRLHEP